jgi:hypothetical protein
MRGPRVWQVAAASLTISVVAAAALLVTAIAVTFIVRGFGASLAPAQHGVKQTILYVVGSALGWVALKLTPRAFPFWGRAFGENDRSLLVAAPAIGAVIVLGVTTIVSIPLLDTAPIHSPGAIAVFSVLSLTGAMAFAVASARQAVRNLQGTSTSVDQA